VIYGLEAREMFIFQERVVEKKEVAPSVGGGLKRKKCDRYGLQRRDRR